MEEKFTIKKAVSLTLAFAFLVMSYTGIMLFLTPKGKIAYWTDWHLLGLTKTQYTDLHITSMFLFLAAGIWHIYFNWKPLMSYVKNHARRITLLKKELLLALMLNALFVVGALTHLPPIQFIIDANEAVKDYWERTEGAPPFGHAEEATLGALARQNGLDATAALSKLRAEGLRAKSAELTLEAIARQNGMTAKEVYAILAPKASANAPVTGLGRRSLAELAQAGHLDLDKSLAYLRQKGMEATPQTRIRDAADALNTTPYALFESLKML